LREGILAQLAGRGGDPGCVFSVQIQAFVALAIFPERGKNITMRTAMTATAMAMETYSTTCMTANYAFDVSLLRPRGISMTIRNTVTATATAMKKYSGAFMVDPLEAMKQRLMCVRYCVFCIA
jgi:hypothetical protein